MNRKISTRQLVESAVLLALGLVLSMIKIKMAMIPGGGSITLLSMLPIVVLGYKYGPAWGGLCGLIHSMLQILEGGLYPPPVQNFLSYALVILLDYALAWSVIGLIAGITGKMVKHPQRAIALGAAVGLTGRFVCSFLSGVVIWGVYAPEGQSVVLYSLTANGLNMLPEIIITTVAGYLIFSVPALRKQVQRAPAVSEAVPL